MAVPSDLSQPSFTNILQSNIDDLRDLVACRICIRFMYEPFTTPCGHTFCYSCLRQWFDRDPAGYTRKTCPDCRAQVLHQPAPAYLVRPSQMAFRVEIVCANDALDPRHHPNLHQHGCSSAPRRDYRRPQETPARRSRTYREGQGQSRP